MARDATPLFRFPEGDFRYQVILDVPVGTSTTVEVRERRRHRRPDRSAFLETPKPCPPPLRPDLPTFADSLEIPLGERASSSRRRTSQAGRLHVTWKQHEQQLLPCRRRPGSSLEIGIVLDTSQSVRRERRRSQAAAAAAARLLGDGDRVFRVDFAATARFLGASRGDPTALFTNTPPSPPKTAIFDGIRFASIASKATPTAPP
jgi:hypothetical protein